VLRWSDELRIGFCADRLVCARLGPGIGPRVLHKQIVDVATGAETPLWKPSLRALSSALKDAKEKRITVILSNRLVRYTVVPWHAELMRRAERLVQARHCFKQIYGNLADAWTISISGGGYRAPVLATAVDQELIEGLRSASTEVGARLVSIVPYLTAAYGQFRRTIDGASYFGVVEQDAIGLLQFDSSGLRSASSQRIHDNWMEELQRSIAQSSANGDAESPQGIRVFAPGQAKEGGRFAASSTVSLPAWRGYSPMTDSNVSMALVGVA
jgi:hypothetical protein